MARKRGKLLESRDPLGLCFAGAIWVLGGDVKALPVCLGKRYCDKQCSSHAEQLHVVYEAFFGLLVEGRYMLYGAMDAGIREANAVFNGDK